MNNINKSSFLYQSIEKAYLILFSLSIFLLPSNLFRVWRIPSSYIEGHFIDYLAPKLYLSQIVLWLFLGVTLVFRWLTSRGRPSLRVILASFRIRLGSWLFLAGGTLLILLFQSLWWQDFGLLMLVVNCIFGPIFLAIFLWKNPNFAARQLRPAVLVATTFQALLGMWQWTTQHSFAGYWFLGEPNLSFPEVALTSLPGAIRVLPYGTTPHPNILAAWLLLGLIVLFSFLVGKTKKKFPRSLSSWAGILLFLLHILVLFLTESWTAWLSGGFFLLAYLLWRYGHKTVFRIWKGRRSGMVLSGVLFVFIVVQIGSLLLPRYSQEIPLLRSLVTPTSWTRRSDLVESSQELLFDHPLGSGFSLMFRHFFDSETSYIGGRFLQPVHNSSLLLLTIGGIWILIVFLLFLSSVHNKYSLFICVLILSLPLFTLDHYSISTISGQYFLILLAVILYSTIKK